MKAFREYQRQLLRKEELWVRYCTLIDEGDESAAEAFRNSADSLRSSFELRMAQRAFEAAVIAAGPQWQL